MTVLSLCPKCLNKNMDFPIILSTIGTTNSGIYYQRRDIYCLCNIYVSGRITNFIDYWHLTTSDKWILSVLQRVHGTSSPWSASPIISSSRSEHVSDNESIRKSLVTRGLTTSAERCYRCSESSQLPIPVLGKTGKIRPVIDLFFPNRQPIVPHVQSNRNSILT